MFQINQSEQNCDNNTTNCLKWFITIGKTSKDLKDDLNQSFEYKIIDEEEEWYECELLDRWRVGTIDWKLNIFATKSTNCKNPSQSNRYIKTHTDFHQSNQLIHQ